MCFGMDMMVFFCCCQTWSWIYNFRIYPLWVFFDVVWHLKCVNQNLWKCENQGRHKMSNSKKKWMRPSTWWMRKLMIWPSLFISEWIAICSPAPSPLFSVFLLSFYSRILLFLWKIGFAFFTWQHIISSTVMDIACQS